MKEKEILLCCEECCSVFDDCPGSCNHCQEAGVTIMEPGIYRTVELDDGCRWVPPAKAAI
jgi:hypothetical protein